MKAPFTRLPIRGAPAKPALPAAGQTLLSPRSKADFPPLLDCSVIRTARLLWPHVNLRLAGLMTWRTQGCIWQWGGIKAYHSHPAGHQGCCSTWYKILDLSLLEEVSTTASQVSRCPSRAFVSTTLFSLIHPHSFIVPRDVPLVHAR